MTQEQQNLSFVGRRLNVLFFIIFIFFSILILRLAFVQLVHGEEHLARVESSQTKEIRITAPRGWIMDRNGHVLVDNKPAYTITFVELERRTQDFDQIAADLAHILDDMSEEEVRRLMDVDHPVRAPKFMPRRIRAEVDERVVAYIAENEARFPGVEIVIEPMRQYRYGDFAAHVLGYTQPIASHQVAYYVARGYQPSDRVGRMGLEMSYETELRGIDGVMEVAVNSRGEHVREVNRLEPIRGNDLVLTIDYEFQKKVEEILEHAVEELRTRERDPMPHVERAIAVVLNPNTGEVLAIGNHPRFDPKHFNHPLSQEQYDKYIRNRDNNLALRHYVAPGSTIKMLTVLMGLQEGIITSGTTFNTGSITIGRDGTRIRDWNEGRGWGRIDARRALQISSNVYMAEIAMAMTRRGNFRTMLDKMDYYHQMFGLGVRTGIDIPFELATLRSSSRQLGNLAHAAIGQYHSYTTMQLALYTSMIANEGYRVRPHIVKEIRQGATNDQPSRVLSVSRPKILSRAEIDPEHYKVVQEGMLMVTQPGGTAYGAFRDSPIKVAAKTGTAQTNRRGINEALIVGYASYENPEIAFAIVVPGGGSGGSATGPIARKIVDAYFGFDKEDIEDMEIYDPAMLEQIQGD